MAKFGLKFGEAKTIVKKARETLGISPSCVWTEELEEEACRLCGGENDHGNLYGRVGAGAQDSVSTAATSASTTAPPSSKTSSASSTMAFKKPIAPPQQKDSSENIGCWSPTGSPKGRRSIGSKHVADLQHETFLEGANIKQEAPKIPVRRHSNQNLNDNDADASGSEEDDSGSYFNDDEEDANMPLPVIRPLRRTDSRSKHA